MTRPTFRTGYGRPVAPVVPMVAPAAWAAANGDDRRNIPLWARCVCTHTLAEHDFDHGGCAAFLCDCDEWRNAPDVEGIAGDL